MRSYSAKRAALPAWIIQLAGYFMNVLSRRAKFESGLSLRSPAPPNFSRQVMLAKRLLAPVIFLFLAALAPCALQAQNISTVVGGGPNNTPALSSAIGTPSAIATDSTGNFYIADSRNNRVYEITPSGNLTVLAGNGAKGYSGDSGPAASAELNTPTGVSVDSGNNIYIADSGNNVIRKVNATYPQWAPNTRYLLGSIIQPLTQPSPGIFVTAIQTGVSASTEPLWQGLSVGQRVMDGTVIWQITGTLPANGGNISTVAGTGTPGATGNGGAATSATLDGPRGVFVDSTGNIFIADTKNNVIREVTISNGNIQTVVGNGTPGYTGDNGAPLSAELQGPTSVFVDASADIFIADNLNNVIREVTAATMKISTVAGTGTAGALGDGGLATAAQLNAPTGVSVDSTGDIFISDTNNNLVREVLAGSLIIQTVAGDGIGGYSGDGGQAIFAELLSPTGIFVDTSADIFIADSGNSFVREVVVNKTIHAYAGNGTLAYSGDSFTALDASLDLPTDVALDGAQNIYVADSGNNVIREVAASTGLVQTAAGRGTAGSSGNGGAATNALLNDPKGVFADGEGDIYIADTGNNVVREVSALTGLIQVVAGTGTAGFTGDGNFATQGELSAPAGVFVDRFGNIFIADSANNRVREVVAATGFIQTVAGNGTAGNSGNNGLATSAELKSPSGVAVDIFGNIFIADTGNNQIREVLASNHNIIAFAGDGTAGYTGDHGAATVAELNAPGGVALDAAGDVFISDTANNVVREVTASNGQIQTAAGTGTANFSGDGGAATAATLNSPRGLTVSSLGGLYIADLSNGRIREVASLVPVPGVQLSSSGLTFAAQVIGTTSASQQITIMNNGAAPLVIASAGVTGGDNTDFVSTNTCSAAVAPGGTCTVNVTFSPLSSGARASTLAIADNAPGSPQLVTLNGTGAGAVSLVPSGLTFPIQIQGQPSTAQPINMTNNQSVILNIFNISIQGTNASGFTQTNTCGSNLAPGASCVISVIFNPNVTGANAAQLTISDDASGANVGKPAIQTAGLSGIGTQAVVVLTPSTLTFPTTVVNNSSATQTVTVANKGVGPLTLTSITPSQTTVDFGETNNCNGTVAAGSSCTLTITFTPISAGTRAGSIVLTDSAGDSPQSVSLSGVGLDFNLSMAASSSSSQTVTAGNPANYTIQVAATGGALSTDSVAVALTCTNLPATVTCKIAPTSVTVTNVTVASANISVTTVARPSVVVGGPSKEYRLPVGFALFAASLALALLFYSARLRIAKRRGAALAGLTATVVLFLLPVLYLAGCGGGSSNSGGTLAGTYTLTITGTNNKDSRQLILTLVVD